MICEQLQIKNCYNVSLYKSSVSLYIYFFCIFKCGLANAGKGSHRKFVHLKYPGAVTISGKSGDDIKKYQEKEVRQAIEMVKK